VHLNYVGFEIPNALWLDTV